MSATFVVEVASLKGVGEGLDEQFADGTLQPLCAGGGENGCLGHWVQG